MTFDLGKVHFAKQALPREEDKHMTNVAIDVNIYSKCRLKYWV